MPSEPEKKTSLKRGIVAYLLSVMSLVTAGFVVMFGVSPGFRYQTARYAHMAIERIEAPSAAALEDRLESLRAESASSPDDPEPLVGVAETLAKLGRHADALAALDKALALDPADRDAILLKARTYVKLGKPSEAIDLLYEATERLEGFDRGEAYLSELLMRTSRASEALSVIDKALKDSPHDRAYLNRRADVLLELGQFKEALAEYDTALAGMPDTPFYDINGRTVRATIEYGRGLALNALGRFDDALKAAKLADKAVPNGGFSLDNRIYANAGLGNYDQAAYLFETNVTDWDMRNSATVYGYAMKMRNKKGDDRLMHLAVDGIARTDTTVRRVYALAVLGEDEQALDMARDIITDRPWMKRVMAARLEMRDLLKKPEAKAVFGG